MMQAALALPDAPHKEPFEATFATLCGVCPAGCGVEVHVVDSVITRLAPLHDHPHSAVCPRGMKANEIVYSPDRILYPQRRVGARGEGRFERITWDQAFDMLADTLRRIADESGAEATCIYTG